MAEDRRTRQRRERSAPEERGVETVRCPYCHDDVKQDALAVRCGQCQTVHHASCFDEKKGCSVDGCGGRGAQVVKGWRAALGECRHCRGKIYLDENVVVCSSCESQHHPACLEARDGCAECGGGEGVLAPAAALQASRKLSALFWALFLLPLVLGVAGSIALVATHQLHLAHAPAIAGVALSVFTGILALKLEKGRRLRALDLAPRVQAKAPPRKDAS
ncbi:MAG TPA: hypothetical protein VFF73_27060 [Planctomycetota bacterium]|nr:hypothetical protein [Planctomycetota bacterium]